MKRDKLLETAKKHGWERGKNTKAAVLAKIRKELEDYFDTEEGRIALANAPRLLLYTSEALGDVDGLPGQKMRAHETTKELAIKLIMQEFGGEG